MRKYQIGLTRKWIGVKSSASRKPRQIEVPVRYGGASGPDIEWVAARHHLSIADVIRLHTDSNLYRLHDGLHARLSIYGKTARIIGHAAIRIRRVRSCTPEALRLPENRPAFIRLTRPAAGD